jgi:hypothetical protein
MWRVSCFPKLETGEVAPFQESRSHTDCGVRVQQIILAIASADTGYLADLVDLQTLWIC